MNNEEETIIVDEEQGIKLLKECEEKIDAHERTRYPAQHAWLQIETQELWRYSDENCSSFEDYVEKKGYDKSYISRLTRAVSFYNEMKVPPHLMPSEYAIRPLMKDCYTQSEKEQIYRDACQKVRNRLGISECCLNGGDYDEKESEDREVASGNDDDGEANESGHMDSVEHAIDVKPTAKDIRDAIDEFTGIGCIILTALDERVEPNISLTDVMQRFSGKINSLDMLLSVLRDYVNQSDCETDEADREAVLTTAKKITDAFLSKINEILNVGAEDDADDAQEDEDDEEENEN